MSEKNPKQAKRILDEIGEAVAAEESDKQMSDDGLKRRRALMTGLAAAPVILSLMNRSAWGAAAEVSCNLVASYVNAGNRWQSPRPVNENGTLEIKEGDKTRCGL
jgi:hypothetical protein